MIPTFINVLGRISPIFPVFPCFARFHRLNEAVPTNPAGTRVRDSGRGAQTPFRRPS